MAIETKDQIIINLTPPITPHHKTTMESPQTGKSGFTLGAFALFLNFTHPTQDPFISVNTIATQHVVINFKPLSKPLPTPTLINHI